MTSGRFSFAPLIRCICTYCYTWEYTYYSTSNYTYKRNSRRPGNNLPTVRHYKLDMTLVLLDLLKRKHRFPPLPIAQFRHVSPGDAR